ncbi:MAG: M23 family metallopeptidase [Elusimicrobia bacterium]|nr:M23 family metallopeptidase [Elusimicrobiota bacterium]
MNRFYFLLKNRFSGRAGLAGAGRHCPQSVPRALRAAAYLVLFAVISASLLIFFKARKPVFRFFEIEKSVVISTGAFASSLYDVLDSYAADELDKYRIAELFLESIDLRSLKDTDEYAIIASTGGILKHIKIRRNLKDYTVSRTDEGGFSFSERDVPVSGKILKINGTVSASLWDSMIPESVPPELVLEFADVFSWSIDFLTEVRDGDAYRMIYEVSKTDKGKEISRRILYAVYDGKETGKKTAVFFKKGYYDETGESLRSFFLRAPLQYRRISSGFSYKRRHPILKYVRPHLGIDYAAPSGTPVSAVAAGVVTYVGWKGGYGRYVEIRHPMGYATSYGHLSRYGKGLKKGRKLEQGDVVGYVGATGIATGPHLDFRIKKSGKFVNFLKLKRFSSKKLNRQELENFKKIAEKYLEF